MGEDIDYGAGGPRSTSMPLSPVANQENGEAAAAAVLAAKHGRRSESGLMYAQMKSPGGSIGGSAPPSIGEYSTQSPPPMATMGGAKPRPMASMAGMAGGMTAGIPKGPDEVLSLLAGMTGPPNGFGSRPIAVQLPIHGANSMPSTAVSTPVSHHVKGGHVSLNTSLPTSASGGYYAPVPLSDFRKNGDMHLLPGRGGSDSPTAGGPPPARSNPPTFPMPLNFSGPRPQRMTADQRLKQQQMMAATLPTAWASSDKPRVPSSDIDSLLDDLRSDAPPSKASLPRVSPPPPPPPPQPASTLVPQRSISEGGDNVDWDAYADQLLTDDPKKAAATAAAAAAAAAAGSAGMSRLVSNSRNNPVMKTQSGPIPVTVTAPTPSPPEPPPQEEAAPDSPRERKHRRKKDKKERDKGSDDDEEGGEKKHRHRRKKGEEKEDKDERRKRKDKEKKSRREEKEGGSVKPAPVEERNAIVSQKSDVSESNVDNASRDNLKAAMTRVMTFVDAKAKADQAAGKTQPESTAGRPKLTMQASMAAIKSRLIDENQKSGSKDDDDDEDARKEARAVAAAIINDHSAAGGDEEEEEEEAEAGSGADSEEEFQKMLAKPTRGKAVPRKPVPVVPKVMTSLGGYVVEGKGKAKAVMKGHTKPVNCVGFSADGSLLASGSEDCSVRLWSIGGAFGQLTVLKAHKAGVQTISWSAAFLLATGGDDGLVVLWDLGSAKVKARLKGHTGELITVSFSPDGAILASWSYDKTIRLWSTEDGNEVFQLDGAEMGVDDMVFTHDGAQMGMLMKDRKIMVMEANSGSTLATFKGPSRKQVVTTMTFSYDSKFLAMASHLEKGEALSNVRIYNTKAGKMINEIEGHPSIVHCLAFSPNGELLVSGAQDGGVRLYMASTGELLANAAEDSGDVLSIDFSPDGEHIAAGFRDGDIRVYRVQDLLPLP